MKPSPGFSAAHSTACWHAAPPWWVLALLLLATGLVPVRAATADHGIFQFTQSAYTAFQTVGYATLTVARTGDTSLPVTLSYTLTDGRALAGTDYDGTPGTVAFAPGDTSQSITIPVTLHAGQPLAFPTPTFAATLLAPAPPSILGATMQAMVTITNNDQFANAFVLPVTFTNTPPAYRMTLNSSTIHGSTAGATLEAGEPVHGQPSSTTSVWYQMSAFALVPITLTCSRGSIDVYSEHVQLYPVTHSTFDHSAGVWRCTFNPLQYLAPFFICISSPGMTPGPFDLNWQTGTSLTTPEYGAVNGGENFPVVVTRHGDLSTAATIVVTPVNGSALAGIDFDGTSKSVTFNPGEQQASTSIATYESTVHEVTKTFSVTLTSVEGNATADISYVPPTFEILNQVPFTPVAGRFQSLITFSAIPYNTFSNLPFSTGFVTATVSTASTHGVLTGHITGRLSYRGTSYPYTATFDGGGYAIAIIQTPASALQLGLESSEGGERLLFGLTESFGDGDVGTGDAYEWGYNTAKTAPCTGSYTAVIGPADNAVAVATVHVSPSGAVTTAVTLEDGSAFTFNSVVSLTPGVVAPSAHAPVYVPLYHGGGSFFGDLQFPSTPVSHQDVTATMTWVSALPDSASAGTGATYPLAGQRYHAPAHGVRALPGLAGQGAFTLGFSGAGLSTTSHTAYWGLNNQINTLQFENPRVFLSVNASTGLVTGSILPLMPKLPALPLRAVILQGTGRLQGFTSDSAHQSFGVVSGQ